MKLNIGEELKQVELRVHKKPPTYFLCHRVVWFAEIKTMELFYDQEELPFMWLREQKKTVSLLS